MRKSYTVISNFVGNSCFLNKCGKWYFSARDAVDPNDAIKQSLGKKSSEKKTLYA